MDFLGMERAEEIVRRHEEEGQQTNTPSMPSPFPPLDEIVIAARRIAAEQGGWLNTRQATALLERAVGPKEYRSISSPIFKADIKRVPAPLSGEVRLEINSFITYLREFKPRKGRTENE